MKRCAAALSFALLLALGSPPLHADTAAVQWNFRGFTQIPQKLKQVAITPLWVYTVSGTNFIMGDKITYTTTYAAGSLTVSNLQMNAGYRVEFVGQYGTYTITNAFPDTNGFLYATDYCAAPTNVSYTVAYSQVQSDARYLGRTNGTGHGIASQGTNTFEVIKLLSGNQGTATVALGLSSDGRLTTNSVPGGVGATNTVLIAGSGITIVTNAPQTFTISSTGGSAAWETDGDGNLMPTVSGGDTYWEDDGSGNLQPTSL